ncbi:hypothetical protein AGOR_G00128240 [Albula goreensis]|uniref:Receptor ligand binding region domain-containing protein n=1 Tax=Albula goreensis TaxID=1534307 RepID=A0A8T3D8Z4_9TELE|nr:hypothetical protein AGOR_G00128240 [Albula goreensis]
MLLLLLLLELVLSMQWMQTERPECKLLGRAERPELARDGDFVIGGIFSFRTGPNGRIPTFKRLPEGPKCKKTIPSDYYQSRALAQLVKHFGWTWVGAVRSDNDYGNNGMATFVQAAQEEGVCIEYAEAFLKSGPHHVLLKVVDVIKHSTSKVIVAFMTHREVKVLVEELQRQNITGLQWIGSDAWITDSSLAHTKGYTALIGALGFVLISQTILGNCVQLHIGSTDSK